MRTTLSKEVVNVKDAIWSGVGPPAGLFFFVLIFTGLFVHGYPAVRPTNAQLAGWLATVNVNTFKVGIYVEAIGIVLFIPFTVWLYRHLRQGTDSSAPATAMMMGAGGWVAVTLPINQAWLGLVDQARSVDIHVAQTVVSINQATYDMTGVVLGVVLTA